MSYLNKQVFIGQGGKVYLDGNLEAHVKDIEVKVTGNFTDLELCGTYETQAVYEGYNCEGTMTVYMTDTDYAEEIMTALDTGTFPSRTIVSNLRNRNSGVESVYSIPDVIFTEVTPVSQKKGPIELSIPFKCGLPRKVA